MKFRYFLEMAYKGTNYHGWQVQENATTVQSVTEDALSKVLGEEIKLTGAGRTDAGVHASYFVAHFDLKASGFRPDLVHKLNSFLPKDISIFSVKKMHNHAHARFDAISRTYRYVISRKKKVFTQGMSAYLYGDLNVEEMNKAAELLREYSDFTTFSKLHSNNKTNICKIFSAGFDIYGDYLIFTITADRFLRNMVRAITSALLETGKGKMDMQRLREIIEAKQRSMAKGTAPAEGLYLSDISYPENYGLKNLRKEELLPFV